MDLCSGIIIGYFKVFYYRNGKKIQQKKPKHKQRWNNVEPDFSTRETLLSDFKLNIQKQKIIVVQILPQETQQRRE